MAGGELKGPISSSVDRELDRLAAEDRPSRGGEVNVDVAHEDGDLALQAEVSAKLTRWSSIGGFVKWTKDGISSAGARFKAMWGGQ